MLGDVGEGTLLELDERRRVSLGKVGRHSRYLAVVEADGTIVLHPATVMTEAQARFNSAPALSAQLDAFLDDPSAAVTRRRAKRR